MVWLFSEGDCWCFDIWWGLELLLGDKILEGFGLLILVCLIFVCVFFGDFKFLVIVVVWGLGWCGFVVMFCFFVLGCDVVCCCIVLLIRCWLWFFVVVDDWLILFVFWDFLFGLLIFGGGGILIGFWERMFFFIWDKFNGVVERFNCVLNRVFVCFILFGGDMFFFCFDVEVVFEEIMYRLCFVIWDL